MVGKNYRLTSDMPAAAAALSLPLASSAFVLRQIFADAPGQSEVVWNMGAKSDRCRRVIDGCRFQAPVAAWTGYRKGEIGSLTASSFELGDEPTVTVEAAYSKRRRRDTQVLHPGLATRRPRVDCGQESGTGRASIPRFEAGGCR